LSAINEAYARIDFATIQELKNKINDLERRIPTEPIAKVRNEDLAIKNTKFFASVIPIPSGSSNSIKVNFGSGTFSSGPVVTATLLDPAGSSGDNELPSLIMRDLSRLSVTVDLRRKTKKRLFLHVIAVGEDG
jgi:hypothetical protein